MIQWHRSGGMGFGSGLDNIRGLMRRVWVLSASGPVSFCQVAGSPASHGRLYVARAVHCQVRQVSSAQLLSVGCSCRNCPATAGVDTAQLSSSAGVRRPFSYSQPLQLLTSTHLSCSLQLGLSRLISCRFTGLLARLPRSVTPSPRTSRQTSVATSGSCCRQGS